MAGVIRRLAFAGAANAAARAVLREAAASPRDAAASPRGALPPGAWLRANYRGREVDLRGGLALGSGLIVSALGLTRRGKHRAGAEANLARSLGAAGAIGVATVAGLVDDMAQDTVHRGLAGHLGELKRGRVTTGLAKLVTITTGAAVFAGLNQFAARSPGPDAGWPRTSTAGALWRAGVDTVLVAGAANLANLLDLRPGRALKAALVPGALLAAGGGPGADLAAGTVGAITAVAPGDLDERTMLGDSGANALGAAIGIAAVRSLRPGGRCLAAALVSGLILASEKISFSKVIATHPLLARLDALGRLE
ncbi:MAG: hypothetical protein LBE08_09100 [Bifidobacteriaceae bacterium]|jgi:hypothetical protein|nr:hypothetical protein [Bifidobacteriaceae bacterium]